MCLAGQDMTPAAPSTLVGYNKPLQVNDDALTRVGHNKPLLLNATTSATAGSTATPPKADPLEIAALELLLAEPANQDMVQRFGGPLLPLPTGTDTGQGIQARYGADLGARLNQLQTAQQTVRAEYCKAMDSAMQSPGPNTPGSVYVPEVRVPADNASPARWDFDPAAFTRQYTSGENPAQKAFAQLHGNAPQQYRQGRDMDGAAPSAHILDSYTLAQGYTNPDEWSRGATWTGTRLEQPEHLLSPEKHTQLINKENLWFDPVHGWSTEAENLKGNLLDRALPMVVMGAITGFMLPPLQAGMSNIGMGTVAQGAVAGAASSAVIQLVTTGKLNFGTLLRSALTAGATTGIMDASGMGDMLKSPQLDTRALGHLGKAGMQGVLQQAIGGKFKDGFTNSLLSSAASEVGAHLDQQIAEQLPDLGPAQASALKLLGRAATSALRIVGSNDPAASFANDFLMGALQDTAAQGKPGKEGLQGTQDKPEGSADSGGLGLKPPRDWVDRLGRSEVSAVPLQGNGPWSEADYRNGMDVQSDQDHDSRVEQEWTAQSDLIQNHRLNELRNPTDSQAWAAMTPDEVEQQVLLDLLGEQAREDSVRGADLLLTGGSSRGGPARGSILMVRNGNWDAALNIGADPFGLLPDLEGLHQDIDKLNRIQQEGAINDMRQRMKDAGMKDVPADYRQSLLANGSTVRDYGATIDDLQTRYEDFVRDRRLRQTWGDDYQNLRIGKSQMTVQEFEKRVLDLQQSTADRAYEKGKEAIARGETPVKEGDYARRLGKYIDEQVRLDLRFFARAEDINDSMASNLWGVNRSIRSDQVDGRGIPDNRLGYNLLADTSLSPKDGNTEQLRRWNTIRPGANYIVIRPSTMPGGGAYVVPNTTIQPYNMPSRALGRKI